MNPVVEAVRQKYPGVYDDLTDDQLTLAIGQKADGAYDDIPGFSDDFKRATPYKADMADVGISGGEFDNVQPVVLPPFGKPGTYTRGLSKALTGAVEGATSTTGVAMAPALMVPGVGPALGAVLSGFALSQAAEKAKEAYATGSPEAAGEATGLGVMGGVGTFLGAKGASGPRVRSSAPPRPTILPNAAAEAAKPPPEFKPSFTVGLPEEQAAAAEVASPKVISAGEPLKPPPVKAPATRSSIASRILQKAGLDQATADQFAELISPQISTDSLASFRDELFAKMRSSGLVIPNELSMLRTEPSYYEALGFTAEEIAEHLRNAEIANRKTVSDAQANNRKILEQLKSGKAAPETPTTATSRTPGTTVAMPEPSELSPEESQALFLDKATAQDNAAIVENKPPTTETGAAPETQAPTAATVSEGKPPGVAAPGEQPAISQPTPEGESGQVGVAPKGETEATVVKKPLPETAVPEPTAPPAQVEAGGAGSAKEPWQMTQGEAIQSHPLPTEQGWKVKVSYLDNPAGPNRGTEEIWTTEKPEKGQSGTGTWGRYIIKTVSRERPTRKQPGYLFYEKWGKEHRASVEKALSEGKPVPAEVLAEYPDLKAPEPQPPVRGPGAAKKGEIRPGAKPYDPSSQALGIIPPLSPFMREDVIPAVQAVVSGITESLEGLRYLLSPVSAGPKARLGAGIIREHAGSLAQKDVQMRAKFAEAYKAMGKLDKPATLDWLDAVEGGARGTLTGPLRTFADEARAALDDRLHQIQALGTGKLQHFIQDYFPHLWKDPATGLAWIQRIFGKRPLRGPASFLKHRTIPTTRDGVNAGLEPVSWNPMDILLAKIHEMDRYIMGQKIFQEFKDKGLAQFSRSDVPPDGYAKIDDRIGNVIQYRPTVTSSGAPGAPERILRGHYFVQEDAARVLNNFLSPGLERYAWYKSLRWIGNNMNMATLGLSGYHGMFTMIDAGTSKLSLGIEQATRGNPIAAATIPRGILGTLAANQIEAFVKGSKVLQEYTKPGSVGGDYTKIVDALVAGGGRVQMPEIYQNSTLKNFMAALKKGNYTGAVLRVPAAALHAFAYPLMNVVVPRLKLGVFFDMAKMELDRLGPTATRDEVRAVMGKVWDSVDNRMGELVYDNLFWNKVLKDLSFLAIRSVGWNLGTLRELGGGVLDTTTVAKRIQQGNPLFTRRMAYVIALPFTVGLMSALYQYLRTGKGPQELRDYRDPKTGNLLPNGEFERVNFPSYLKDVESVKRHPGQTAINKLHPMWGTIAEMIQNKDYYGTEIIHPGDQLVRQVADEFKFIGKAFIPYGVSGAQKRGKVEEGIEPKIESFFGIMPVPAELTRTPAENLAIKIMSGHRTQAARTREEFEQRQKEQDAVQQIRTGKLTLTQARAQGLIEASRLKDVRDRLKFTYLQYAIKHLSPDEAFQVLERSNPKEIESVATEVRTKIMRSTSLPAKEKAEYLKTLKGFQDRK